VRIAKITAKTRQRHGIKSRGCKNVKIKSLNQTTKSPIDWPTNLLIQLTETHINWPSVKGAAAQPRDWIPVTGLHWHQTHQPGHQPYTYADWPDLLTDLLTYWLSCISDTAQAKWQSSKRTQQLFTHQLAYWPTDLVKGPWPRSNSLAQFL